MVFLIARTAFGPPERVLAGFLPTRTREPESAKCVKSYPAQYLRDSGLPELAWFYDTSAAAWHIVPIRCSISMRYTTSIIDFFGFCKNCVLEDAVGRGRNKKWKCSVKHLVSDMMVGTVNYG